MKQFVLIIDGPMGSGKSTIGDILHKKLKRTALLSTDRIKWFVSDFKRDKADNAIAANVLRKMTEAYVIQGMNILLPQAFWKKENIDYYLKIAKKYKLKVFIYQLIAPKSILQSRLNRRKKPTKAKTPISQARINSNFKMWEENRYNLGKIFDTSKLSANKIAKMIINDLKISED